MLSILLRINRTTLPTIGLVESDISELEKTFFVKTTIKQITINISKTGYTTYTNTITIKDIHNQTRLPIINNLNIVQVEQRLLKFIESNNLDKLDNNFDKIKELIKELIDSSDKKKDYKNLFQSHYSNIIKDTNDKIKEIITFVEKSPQLNKYLKSIKFEEIFRKIIDLDDYNFPKKIIEDTLILTVLISKNIDEKTKVPKYWMRNQYNSEILQTFLKTKRYSMHNHTFIKSSEQVFKKYFDKSDYFINLSEYILYISKRMDLLNGVDNTYFTKKNAEYINKNIFVNYFYSYVNYITNMSSINNDVPNMDNILYELLENNNKDKLDDSIMILSSYFIDILSNMIQEYLDPQWINNKELTLSERIGIQKEREKQSLIKKLDIMTPEERLLAVQKQNYVNLQFLKLFQLFYNLFPLTPNQKQYFLRQSCGEIVHNFGKLC